jgi:hypothetical protein
MAALRRIPLVTCIVGLSVAVLTSPAAAFLRVRFEDQQIVERSPLIVVGRIKPESIQYVRHEDRSHRVTLVVEEIIKGERPHDKELPVVIHYGLTPVVDGRWEHDGTTIGAPAAGIPNHPKGIIEIMDTGNSAHTFVPLVPDARDKHLWFLRSFKTADGGQRLGIRDPEDVQPLELTQYFLCYLATDPESAVRARVQKQPAVAARAMRYLVHREIERIVALPDAGQRVERTIPYWLAGYDWNYRGEAEMVIADAGAVAGPYLQAVFEQRPDRRENVIRLWGAIGYRDAVPRLIELLKEKDRYWSGQKLARGWWNDDTDPQWSARREEYSETYAAVVALDRLDDPSAREVVERTRARWEAFHFDENPQIVEACDKALKRWAAATASTQPATKQ